MARKPDNNNVRKMKGEKNKERYLPENDIKLLDQIPEPPDYLNIDGVKTFKRVASYLITHKVLTDLDYDHLGLMVDIHTQIVQMRKSGINPPMTMYTTWKSYSSDLFLNAMARQKMMSGTSTKKGNKYAPKK